MRFDRPQILLAVCCLGLTTACTSAISLPSRTPQAAPNPIATAPREAIASPQLQQVVAGAIAQVNVTRSYDPAYVVIDYPGGDVPLETGVCTDVVVRAFRAVGFDLQKVVHEDMQRDFAAYPQEWGLTGPDPNIDHRRVPNLMRFFERQGMALLVTKRAASYQPGDVVTWDLGDGQWHIGMVSNLKSPAGHLLIVHNVGVGAQVEDVLFRWPILGHYRLL